MQYLELKNCSIKNFGCEAIAEGLGRNTLLKILDLSSNKITGNGLHKWSDILGKTGITHLDFSNNNLGDEGILCIVKGLSFA